jgi:hypothetical protein
MIKETKKVVLSRKVLQIKDFNDAFELVKMTVNIKFKTVNIKFIGLG